MFVEVIPVADAVASLVCPETVSAVVDARLSTASPVEVKLEVDALPKVVSPETVKEVAEAVVSEVSPVAVRDPVLRASAVKPPVVEEAFVKVSLPPTVRPPVVDASVKVDKPVAVRVEV